MRAPGLLLVLSLAVVVFPSVYASGSVEWSMDAGWVLHDVRVMSGFDARMDLDAAGAATMGIWVYDTNWVLIGGLTGSRADNGVWASLAMGADSPAIRADLLSTPGGGQIQVVFAGGGNYHLLTFLVGDRASVSARIDSGDLGAQIIRTDASDHVFYETGASMRAPLGARVHARAARVVVEDHARVDLEVSRGLIALIGLGSGTTKVENVTLTWAGGERSCPCVLSAWPGSQGFGPGHYTITRSAVKAEIENARPLIVGIDVN